MVNRKKRRVVADCLYADSHNDADQQYLSGFFVPDRFLTLRRGRKKIGVFSELEINRAQKESRLTDILSLSEIERAAGEWLDKKDTTVADHIAWLAKVYNIDHFRLPENFPGWLLEGMRKHSLDYQVIRGALFPSRYIKTGVEAEMVREGNRCSAAGFKVVFDMLRGAQVKDGVLVLQGKTLTSEWLRQEIEIACLRAGGVAQHTIVAGGDEACDPHCEGSGPLRANELIIVDIFPRMKKHGYHGDMTRTFLKGIATEEQRQLMHAVQGAHQLAISMVKASVQGSKIHRAVQNHFKHSGYKTERVDGIPTGFFHGTGHGLGLEIHEPLRISQNKFMLRAGHVFTIEPGLYYPGLGGCRVEDVVWVTETGCELLSKAPYEWEIP